MLENVYFWICIGLILLISEIVVSGIFLMWFGLAALAMSASIGLSTLGFINHPLSILEIILLFVFYSFIFVWLGRKIYGTKPNKEEQPLDYLVGKTGEVKRIIGLNDKNGQVFTDVEARLIDTIWIVHVQGNLKGLDLASKPHIIITKTYRNWVEGELVITTDE